MLLVPLVVVRQLGLLLQHLVLRPLLPRPRLRLELERRIPSLVQPELEQAMTILDLIEIIEP